MLAIAQDLDHHELPLLVFALAESLHGVALIAPHVDLFLSFSVRDYPIDICAYGHRVVAPVIDDVVLELFVQTEDALVCIYDLKPQYVSFKQVLVEVLDIEIYV